MYYPDELVEEIRARCNIVDLISGYVSLKKKGGNYFGLCPFHSEKSASFSVNEERQMFHCFGCGVSGNAYTFLMKYENFSFPEAIQFLARREGLELPESSDPQAGEREKRRKLIYSVNKEAATYFYYALRHPSGQTGLNYFKKRELSEDTMQHFGLGYADKNSRRIINYLRSKGFSDEVIMDSGIADFSEKHGMSCKFWNRVIFPIQDIGHRVIGFGGRVMGEGEPKYLNSPETDIFNKRKNLYGLNWARTSKADHMILCEGYMDVIAMHQAGFTQAVASLGTAFTDQQAVLLKRYVNQVILSYDSDGPGIKAALRAIAICRQAGLSVKVLHLEPYKDPDEFIKNLGKEEFEKRLKDAENGFYFETGVLEKDFDLRDPDEKTRFHNEIAKKLCGITQQIQRENYLDAVAGKYGINPQILRDAVKSYAAAGITDENGTGSVMVRGEERKLPAAVRRELVKSDKLKKNSMVVLYSIVNDPALYKRIRDYLRPEDFIVPVFCKAAGMIFESVENSSTIDPAGFISKFENEEDQRDAAGIFHIGEDASYKFNEDLSDSGFDITVFIDAVLSVKTSAREEKSKTASMTDVMRYDKEISEIKKILT